MLNLNYKNTSLKIETKKGIKFQKIFFNKILVKKEKKIVFIY
jgi:phage antirepressor YoqD-like protein